MTRRAVRQNIVRRLRRSLMGPGTDNESTHMLPTIQYITGILYPTILEPDVVESKPEEDYDTGSEDEVSDEDQETHTDSHLPRSMGLSVVVSPEDLPDSGISVTVSGSIYRQEGTAWRRVPISGDAPYIELPNSILGISFDEKKKLTREISLRDLPGGIGDELRRFSMRWESSRLVDGSGPGRWHLSVFLVNRNSCMSNKRASFSLYQAYLKISTGGKRAIVAREARLSRRDDDLRSLSLLYSRRHEYGVGHQCSVNWDSRNDSDALTGQLPAEAREGQPAATLLPAANVDDNAGRCSSVETTFFPEYHTRAPDFRVHSGGAEVKLGWFQLSDEDYLEGSDGHKEENLALLRTLAEAYEAWIRETFDLNGTSEQIEFHDVSRFNRADCMSSLARIREGIDVLSKDEVAYSAFCLMNRAIWLQYINKEASKASAGPYIIKHSDHRGFWRPFQLAFILQSIPSLIDENHKDRGIIDLLWIQTGGGKTEAYLGLVAFLLFINRLRQKAGPHDGAEVMMRYTLRLLTLQQFQRAARLILACEYIRLTDSYSMLAKCKPFSLGLYVGQKTTPNVVKTGKTEGGFDNDYDIYEKVYLKDKASHGALESCDSTAEYALYYWDRHHELPEDHNPVQILSCPWCGQEMKRHDFTIVGRSRKWTIETRCSNPKCCFHKHAMPIHTVDECIHSAPPSLLIGTVDKFAQLPFNEKMSPLFGWRDGVAVGAPPSLIIQDELHLINGPLGSMVGLYEATVDLMSMRGLRTSQKLSLESLEVGDIEVTWQSRPKMIASTATIRNARLQCRQLYNRLVTKFPSAGISIEDSFFTRDRGTDEGDKAYVGLLCAGVAMKSSAKKFLSETINLVSDERNGRPIGDVDPYWTTVSYYGSRRELGSAVTLLRDDVRNAVASRRKSMMTEKSIAELHGGLHSTELPTVLSRMNTPADGSDPYDVICCTNMFSVGVDVDRLGLMLMNCQPNATTEYLQSTGRVGRTGDGLVVTLFNPSRPRDQSHFESFYDYHSRVQLHVESMTVTPYSEGCLERALHAQYVAMLRHMFPRTSLPDVRDNPQCKNYSRMHRDHEASLMFMAYLIKRARAATANGKSRSNLIRSLKLFHEEWFRRIEEADDISRKKGAKLEFYYQGKSYYQYHVPRLFETDPASQWYRDSFVSAEGFVNRPILTPNSLRYVETEVDLVELRVRR